MQRTQDFSQGGEGGGHAVCCVITGLGEGSKLGEGCPEKLGVLVCNLLPQMLPFEVKLVLNLC